MIDMLSVILALVLGAALYYYFKGLTTFFKDRGIPEVKTIPVVGGMWKMFIQQKTMAELVDEAYKQIPEAKYVGFYDFTTPTVMIRDPELIKSVTVKNFEHFQDHRTLEGIDKIEPMFSKNLLGLRGERWKEVRTLLSPAFTSSKMKAMFKLMRECAVTYGNYFATLPEKSRCVELKDAFTRYTNDVIATCAFGINVDSMTNRDNKFYAYGKTATSFGRWQVLKFLLVRWPTLCKFLGITLFDPVITKFFHELVATTIKTRDEQGIVRPDMIQLMMETRGKMGLGKELTIEDMTAQAFVFFFGGFESTSTLMCFAAYEIGVNQEVQNRLHEEIDEVLETNNGQVSYEAINDMKYLDAIINEALRMYPVIVAVDRACTKPFELPSSLPGLKPHVVQKGEFLSIPIYGIQYDPQYYEEPTKFMPERFLDDPKKVLNSGTYLSFGLGPRMCIGNRFALLETKVLLFQIFARCTLKPNAKTPIPMVLSNKGFQMTAKGGFWFDIEPRKNAAPVLVNSVSNGSAIR